MSVVVCPSPSLLRGRYARPRTGCAGVALCATVTPAVVAGLFPGIGAVDDATFKKCRGLGFPKPRAAFPKVGGSNKAFRLWAVLYLKALRQFRMGSKAVPKPN